MAHVVRVRCFLLLFKKEFTLACDKLDKIHTNK